MEILVASSSVFRQSAYREMIDGLGHGASCAGNGVECLELLRTAKFDLLILEAPLLWGGSEGVLDIVQNAAREQRLPVILVAVGVRPIDWLQLSRFQIDDLLFRVPTAHDLTRAVNSICERMALRSMPPCSMPPYCMTPSPMPPNRQEPALA